MRSMLKSVFYILLLVNTCTSVALAKTDNVEEVAKHLQSLAQYEIDNSYIITQSMDNVNNHSIKEELLKMRKDCEGNIKELASMIREYGREAPTHSRDFKGFFMQGYVAMRGLLSDKGVMKALHSNYMLVMRAYEDALNSDLPENVKQKVRKIYNAKEKHVEYIVSQL